SYFDFQRASAIVPLFGIDVITICQGRCSCTTNGVSTSTVPIRNT
ncbi:unnamed protein product, partial [Rotaria socialis]